ncbi:MAG: ATP-binding protein [Hyphomonadaceae bacterium]|jgi:hypothetical protein|nr:ATP-binding protein [Hyphomonadaceae bacterium]
MIPRSFDDIDISDIQRLIDNQVAERRTLEFKRDLPGDTKDERKEFLADVTSFANAQGGDIIYGLAEAQGAPSTVHGLDVLDADAELRRIEDRILDGVEPRLPGLRLKWITTAVGKRLLLIRIPASTISPHRVIFANSSKFHGRKSNGKYEMDTQELREAFTATEALPARLRALHLEAVDAALRDELPAGLGDGPKAIVSVIPLNYFRDRLDLDITRENALAPFKPGGHMEAVEMIEGVLLHTDGGGQGRMDSYAVTHRRGRTDMVWTIGYIMNPTKGDGRPVVPYPRFKEGLIDGALSPVSRLQPFSVEGPWVVLTTITGIKDFILLIDNDHYSDPAWRDQATLAEVVSERLTHEDLVPVLKSFWRLFGMRPPIALTAT